MDAGGTGQRVKAQYEDLELKWRKHGDRIKEFWRSFDQGQRTKAMKAGQVVVLKHSRDASLGNVHKLVPDYNLQDVTGPGDYVLELMEHRATKPLGEQFMSGFNGRPGDSELIEDMMRNHNLRHVQPFTDCWTFFVDDDLYGSSFKLVKEKEQSLAAFRPAIEAGLCIPQAKGELVMARQEQLLISLSILCDDILDIGSTTRSKKPIPKKPTGTASAALSNLNIKLSDELPKLDLPRLIEDARDQKAAMDDALALICTEPVVLAHEVNLWFFSRPELVRDEKGRSLPVHTDKYISASILEAVHNAVRAAATWDYMIRLLELLGATTDKHLKPIILQEISNLCQLEYSRTQALFKRQISAPISDGSKWFKRVSNAYDNGIPRVSLKGKPEQLMQDNPHLYYLLRLSQPDTTASKAVEWFKKLDAYESSHPGAGEYLSDREADSFGDLAVIVSFIHSLTPLVSLPAFNRKKAQYFVTKSAHLETELNEIKSQLDLRDYAAPIDNLLEPGMTEASLNALDKFLVEKTGTKVGFLYQDLIEECIDGLQAQLKATSERQAKPQADKEAKIAEYVPFPVEAPQAPDVRIQARKEKEKTRPAHSSVFEILPSEQTDDPKTSNALQSPPAFKVKDTTFDVFETLLSSSKARGSVSWYSFESALADLGFSVIPKFGSVYTFIPPHDAANQRPLTVHRPHNSQIEGYKLLSYARRLKRVYGWKPETFEIN
ncbi:hypothetical protein LQW54_012068 [Pestalotiopsis sp. IQ-011]